MNTWVSDPVETSDGRWSGSWVQDLVPPSMPFVRCPWSTPQESLLSPLAGCEGVSGGFGSGAGGSVRMRLSSSRDCLHSPHPAPADGLWLLMLGSFGMGSAEAVLGDTITELVIAGSSRMRSQAMRGPAKGESLRPCTLEGHDGVRP